MFKTNSRFSSLMDDIPDKKNKKDNKKEIGSSENRGDKFNSFKSEKNDNKQRELSSPYDDNRFRSYDYKQRDRYRQEREAEMKIQKEFEEREKERKKMEALNMDKFPDLFGNIKKDEIKDETKNEESKNISYIEKLKKENEDIKQNIDPDLEILKPGWVLLKKDKNSNKIIRKYHPETKQELTIEEKTDQEIGINIINALVELHERRTREFIELNGYDTWEKMYKFPNWQEEEENYSDSENETEEEDNIDDDLTYN